MQSKIFFKNGKGVNLSAVIDYPEKQIGAKWILMLHGFCGDKNENGLFIEASDYFTKNGYTIFRFDVTGAGESLGYFQDIGLAEQKQDFFYALSWLRENYDGYKFVIGFSLGATVSIMNHQDFINSINAYSFWSPAIFPSRDMYPRYITEEITEEISKKGYFEKSGLKVGEKIIMDLRDCNLVPMIEEINLPTLLIHGTRDERISHCSTEIAKSLFKGRAEIELIEGEGHSFRYQDSSRGEVFQRTLDFFESCL